MKKFILGLAIFGLFALPAKATEVYCYLGKGYLNSNVPIYGHTIIGNWIFHGYTPAPQGSMIAWKKTGGSIYFGTVNKISDDEVALSGVIRGSLSDGEVQVLGWGCN